MHSQGEPQYGEQNSAQVYGMRPPGEEVTASTTSPAIFVEIYYEYQPIIAFDMFADEEIYTTAAFLVRNDRDQSQVYKRNTLTQPSDCNSKD